MFADTPWKEWVARTLLILGVTLGGFPLSKHASAAPAAPMALSPGSATGPGPVVNTTTPTLVWTSAAGASSYSVAISIYPYGTSNIIYSATSIQGTSHPVPGGYLTAGQKYRWNMRAWNSAGPGDYSNTLYFQTQAVTYNLTVNCTGSGSVSPQGCGAIQPYSQNAPVTLTATPTSGWQFGGWSGACTGAGSCQLTMNGAKTVTATFTQATLPPATPTAQSPGTGSEPGQAISGLTPTLSWSPSQGADYYSVAISIYPYGTSNIIYSATSIQGTSHPVPGGYLTAGQKYRWNMRAWNSAGPGDYSNTLYFQTQAVTHLTVNCTGSGSVSPQGCRATQSYSQNAPVTLTATPTSGWQFGGWSGACTGAGSCQLTMNGAKTVTATFTQVVTLPSPPTPTSPGSSSSLGPTDPTKLTVTEKDGKLVEVGPQPPKPWQGYVLTVPLTQIGDIKVSPTGETGAGPTLSISPTTGDFDTRMYYFNAGSTVTLEATAKPGYRFSHWMGDALGATSSFSVNIDRDMRIAPSFVSVDLENKLRFAYLSGDEVRFLGRAMREVVIAARQVETDEARLRQLSVAEELAQRMEEARAEDMQNMITAKNEGEEFTVGFIEGSTEALAAFARAAAAASLLSPPVLIAAVLTVPVAKIAAVLTPIIVERLTNNGLGSVELSQAGKGSVYIAYDKKDKENREATIHFEAFESPGGRILIVVPFKRVTRLFGENAGTTDFAVPEQGGAAVDCDRVRIIYVRAAAARNVAVDQARKVGSACAQSDSFTLPTLPPPSTQSVLDIRKGDIVRAVLGGLKVREPEAGRERDTVGYGRWGVILDGPRSARLGNEIYNWWRIRWADSNPKDGAVEGWSAEGDSRGGVWLEKVTLAPSRNWKVGDGVTVTSDRHVRDSGRNFDNVYTVPAGTKGIVMGGPVYQVLPDTGGFYSLWYMEWSGGDKMVRGWSEIECLPTDRYPQVQVSPPQLWDLIFQHFDKTGKEKIEGVKELDSAYDTQRRGEYEEYVGTTAYAVARAESDRMPRQCGDNGLSMGLWQIHMPSHFDIIKAALQREGSHYLFDADNNAAVTAAISKQGKNWRPWCTWETGCKKTPEDSILRKRLYEDWLKEARDNMPPQARPPTTPSPPEIVAQLAEVSKQVTRVWGFDTDTQSWKLYDHSIPTELSTLPKMAKGQGYFVFANEATTMTTGGVTTYLSPGWNLVAWLD